MYYFRRNVLENPDRSNITQEMCERVVDSGEHEGWLLSRW
jgi:hypothetical protein